MGGRSPTDDYRQEKLSTLLFGSIFEQRVMFVFLELNDFKTVRNLFLAVFSL